MGIFDFVKKKNVEKRSDDISYGGSSTFSSFFGSRSTITERQAMQIPAVAGIIELITSSISQLPIYVYQKNENDEVINVEDKRNFLLNGEPNDSTNAHNFKKAIVKDYLFNGQAYVKVDRSRNDIIALYNLPAKHITIEKIIIDGYKTAVKIRYNGGGQSVELDSDDVAMIFKGSIEDDELAGILNTNTKTLQLALDEQSYTTGILKNGALPIGILKATSRLTTPAIDRLRVSWENLYSGATKAGKTIILEEGLDYQPISMKPNELDLTNIKKTILSDISRAFNVPESMINAAANKYASNEQNNIHFLQYCISPIISTIESAFNKALLLESEKENGYYFHFDTAALLRTTEKENIEAATMGMKEGLFSVNEARGRVDMPKLPVDYHMWSLGSIFYDSTTGLFAIPNTGIVMDPKDLTSKSEQVVPGKPIPGQPIKNTEKEEVK